MIIMGKSRRSRAKRYTEALLQDRRCGTRNFQGVQQKIMVVRGFLTFLPHRLLVFCKTNMSSLFRHARVEQFWQHVTGVEEEEEWALGDSE